jgi:hypothetical protein
MVAMFAQSSHSSSGPTAADRELALAASALADQPISEWQIKRWREAGLLPTTREFRGRGRGSGPVGYLPQAQPHAACIADALARNLTVGETCLVCFLRGFPPRERALKRAYADSYKRLTGWLERTAGGTDDPWTIADAVARLLARRSAGIPNVRAAKQRLRDAGKPPSALRDVLVNVMSAALGSPSRLHADTLLAFGMGGLTMPIGPAGALATSDDLKLNRFSLPALADAAQESPLAELEQARDAILILRDVTVRFASILTRTHGIRLDQLDQLADDDLLSAVIGVPAALITRLALGKDTFDENLAKLRSELPRLLAMQRLLDALPPDLYPYLTLSATSLAALPEPQFERFRSEVQTYFDAHPEDVPSLTDTNGPPQTTDP